MAVANCVARSRSLKFDNACVCPFIMHVRVLVRARPLLPSELDKGSQASLLHLDTREGKVSLVNKQGGTSNFAADHVCDSRASQDDIFRLGQLHEMVGAVAEGYNATVFAYGQTGSGKTFTMEGYEYNQTPKGPVVNFDTPRERLGVVPRTVNALFEAIQARNSAAAPGAPKYRVLCNFVQIYKEQVLDLLNPAVGPSGSQPVFGGGGGSGDAPRGLKLRWSPQKEFFVDNLFIEEVETADDALHLFQKGVRNKRMAETRMNSASSRSHCMLTLQVQQLATDRAEHVLAEGRLTLVDLAGSERQHALIDATSKAGMAESVQINKSLFTLRKVILSLSEAAAAAQDPSAGGSNGKGGNGKLHVPYRDSTLTRLLKPALGGNCHTLMVACLSPSDAHCEENASTLAYAARARAITNAPVVNLDPHTAQVAALKKEILRLKQEVARLTQIIALGAYSAGEAPAPAALAGSAAVTSSTAAAAGAKGGAVDPDALLSGPCGTGNGALAVPGEAAVSVSSPRAREASGGGREAELSSLLAKEQASSAAQSTALAQSISLARSLAATNSQLRQAFDTLAEQRDALEASHGLLLVENTTQRERLALLELTLAMESYPSAPHESMQARVEQQLRSAAQEVVALRNENAALKDRVAVLDLSDGAPPNPPGGHHAGGHHHHQQQLSGGYGGGPLASMANSNIAAGGGSSAAFAKRQSANSKHLGGKRGGGRQQQPEPPPQPVPPPPPPPVPLALSSTGGLMLSSAWMPPPPEPQATVPKLVPDGTGPPKSTLDDLDQLTMLLRKRAEMKSQRPSTAMSFRDVRP